MSTKDVLIRPVNCMIWHGSHLKPLWYYKITALYAQDFQNTLDKMADDGLSQSMLEKERTLISKLYRTAIGWRVVDANLAIRSESRGGVNPRNVKSLHGWNRLH